MGQGDPDKDCPFQCKSSASDVGKRFSRLVCKVALGSPVMDDETLCLLAVEGRSIVGACAALYGRLKTREMPGTIVNKERGLRKGSLF